MADRESHTHATGFRGEEGVACSRPNKPGSWPESSDIGHCGQRNLNLFPAQWKTPTGNNGVLDDVKETPSYDFVLVAADGDIDSSPGRFNDHRQKLLAG